MAVIERRLQALDRRDVDDCAAVDHERRGLPRHRDDATDVHAQHLGGGVVVDLLECDDRLHARVVDDEVEPAEGVDRAPADRGRVALDVAGGDGGAVAELRGRASAVSAPVRMHDDGRAGLVEPPRDTTADRSAGTRDDGDATGEIQQFVDRRGSHACAASSRV